MTFTGARRVVPVSALGRRFRSLTEARWALFLDALGVGFEHEPETFNLGSIGWYLPDFWIPRGDLFLEVKPVEIEASDRVKAIELSRISGKRVALAQGFGVPREDRFAVPWPIPGFSEGDPGCIRAFRDGALVSGNAFALCECGWFGLEWDDHDCPRAGDSLRPWATGKLLNAYRRAASYRPDSR